MHTIILFVAIFACSVCQAAEYFSERYLVEIAHPNLKADQRIVSFKISLKGAKFDSVDPLPPGWNITIKNESNGVASIDGEIDVGIAALSVRNFTKTISLRKYLANEKDFTISAELVVLGGYAEEKDTTLQLEAKHLILLKIKP